MAGKYLLDTNIVIALLAGEDTIVSHAENAEGLFVSVITLGELYFGAHNSARSERNLAILSEFTETSNVLICNAISSQYYAVIKQQLKLQGTPIPENDIWIAAIAMQHHLELITRDKHFQAINALTSTRW